MSTFAVPEIFHISSGVIHFDTFITIASQNKWEALPEIGDNEMGGGLRFYNASNSMFHQKMPSLQAVHKESYK